MIQTKSIFLLALLCVQVTGVLAQPVEKAGVMAMTGVRPLVAWEAKCGTLVTERLASAILRENRINLDANRRVKVFLPPGYAESGKSYPVVYYCHSIFWTPEKMFENGNLANLLERGFAEGVVGEFIFVAADYNTPTTGSVYENSPISGFSRRLEDLGVEHEAEEYRGDPWNRTWTPDGRFYTRLLPFLARHLVFEAAH